MLLFLREAKMTKKDQIPNSKKNFESKIDKETTESKKTEARATESKQVGATESKQAEIETVKLNGLYAFKKGMSSVYDEKGTCLAVTFLKMPTSFVSQVKTKQRDGYESIQIAFVPQKNERCSKAIKKHLSPAGFEQGARYIREVRQSPSENIKVAQPVSIHSIQKGDMLKLTSVSKGHGFAGVVKRWHFKGGPASHGAKTHRTSGSIGNRTEPARVMPGKKMPGHYGVRQTSLKNVRVIDVIPDEQLIVVKGSVAGARNSLVYLHKI